MFRDQQVSNTQASVCGEAGAQMQPVEARRLCRPAPEPSPTIIARRPSRPRRSSSDARAVLDDHRPAFAEG
jgi:hypothetical protein